MATLTIELPDELLNELNQRQTSDELIRTLVEQSLRTWLHKTAEIPEVAEQSEGSPFSKSAFPFVEQLIDENLTLFERLAKL